MSRPRSYRLDQVDAFTRASFSGNPAGVVLEAKGLTNGEMQAIARELGNPETAFVLPAEGDDHDVRVRLFTRATGRSTCGRCGSSPRGSRDITRN